MEPFVLPRPWGEGGGCGLVGLRLRLGEASLKACSYKEWAYGQRGIWA